MAGEIRAPTSGVLPRGSRRGAEVRVCPDLGPRSPAPALGGGTGEAVSGCQLCNPLGSQRLGSGFSGRVFFGTRLRAGGCWDASSHAALAALQPLEPRIPLASWGRCTCADPAVPSLPAPWLSAHPAPSAALGCRPQLPAVMPAMLRLPGPGPPPGATQRSWICSAAGGEETAQGLAAGATCPAWRGRVWHRFWHTQAGGSAAACTPALRPVPSSSVHFHHCPHPCALQPHPPQPPPPRSSPSTPIPLLALCPVALGVTVPTAPGRL